MSILCVLFVIVGIALSIGDFSSWQNRFRRYKVSGLSKEERISHVATFISGQIELCVNQRHLSICEDLIDTMLLDKFPVADVSEHVKDLRCQLSERQIALYITNKIVSYPALIREMDKDELDELCSIVSPDQTGLLELCRKQYRQIGLSY